MSLLSYQAYTVQHMSAVWQHTQIAQTPFIVNAYQSRSLTLVWQNRIVEGQPGFCQTVCCCFWVNICSQTSANHFEVLQDQNFLKPQQLEVELSAMHVVLATHAMFVWECFAADREVVVAMQLCPRPGVPHRGGCWSGPCECHQGGHSVTHDGRPLLQLCIPYSVLECVDSLQRRCRDCWRCHMADSYAQGNFEK